MEDYFNYGFTEESYKVYAKKVIKIAEDNMQELVDNEGFEREILDDENRKYNKTVNFYLPHEFGGCGQPVQQELYEFFNIYTPQMDLAKIQPKWTTKHDFMVELPKNEKLDEVIEEQVIQDDPQNGMTKQDSKTSKMSFNVDILKIVDKESFAQQFKKTVLNEFESKTLPILEQRLKQAQLELKEERQKYLEVESEKQAEWEKCEKEANKAKDLEKQDRIQKQREIREQK